jgi:plastocyanin
VNLVASDAKELTVSATPANVAVAQGDTITFESTHIGSGITDPGGIALVEITRS